MSLQDDLKLLLHNAFNHQISFSKVIFLRKGCAMLRNSSSCVRRQSLSMCKIPSPSCTMQNQCDDTTPCTYKLNYDIHVSDAVGMVPCGFLGHIKCMQTLQALIQNPFECRVAHPRDQITIAKADSHTIHTIGHVCECRAICENKYCINPILLYNIDQHVG